MDNAVVGSQVDRLNTAIDEFVKDRDYFEKLADEHFQRGEHYKNLHQIEVNHHKETYLKMKRYEDALEKITEWGLSAPNKEEIILIAKDALR